MTPEHDTAVRAIPAMLREHGLTQAHVRPWTAHENGATGRLGSFRRADPETAWNRSHIELNPANGLAVLALDIDDPCAAFDLMNPVEWLRPVSIAPNWTVTNLENGHSHAVWTLRHPIHSNPRSRNAPLDLYAALANAYVAATGADRSFNGRLTRNPVYRANRLRTNWIRREPCTMRELRDGLPDFRWHPANTPPESSPSGFSRNLTLARRLAKWAGSWKNAGIPVLDHARRLNAEFDPALSHGEIIRWSRSIERSRNRWIRQGRMRRWDSASQKRRNRRSQLVRKAAAAKRNVLIRAAVRGGASQVVVAERMGVSRRTVQRALRGG